MSTHRHPHDAATPELSANVTPLSRLTSDEIAALADAEYQHVDYDLHPLRVQSLDHYLDRQDDNARFRIL